MGSKRRLTTLLHLLGLLSSMPGIALAANLAYVDLGLRGQACCMVPDGAGGVFVMGRASGESGATISVTRLDTTQRVIANFRIGGSADQPRAAAIDPFGNLVIAGETRSSDFPLVQPLIALTEPGAPAGFIVKVSPMSGQILFSTRIGGVAVESVFRLGTTVNAVAVDSTSNIYAAGVTNAKDFPVTANAYQKTGAGGDSFGPRQFGFVLKLSPDGGRLLYSTLLGGLTANCFGGSHCIGKNASTTVNALGVDPNGIVTVGGSTNAPDFPATAGAVQTVCRCQEYANNGFVTRLNADGSGLLWSTFLGGTWYGFSQLPLGVNSVSALALDSAGTVTVAGRTDADDFPTTAGAVQPKFAGAVDVDRRSTDGFLSKLNATGTELLYSTYLGGLAEDTIRDVQLDAQGTVWLSGSSSSVDFPSSASPVTGSFFAATSQDGTRILTAQRTPEGAAGQAIHAGRDLWVLGPAGSVLYFPAREVKGAAVFGVASSASGPVKGYIAPGEFVSLYGNLGGPPEGVGAVLDSQGRISAQLAGVRVLFNGIPAPLLYAGATQINALVPYGIATASMATMQVTTGAGDSLELRLYIRPAQPEVFRIGTAALALNQDQTLNSLENPAAPGSTVTIFASGPGLLSGQQGDGVIPTGLTSTPVLPVAVLLENRSLEVLYAGNAPGLVVNALQINLRLPEHPAGDMLQIIVGSFFSSSLTLFIQQ